MEQGNVDQGPLAGEHGDPPLEQNNPVVSYEEHMALRAIVDRLQNSQVYFLWLKHKQREVTPESKI
jgi:hypothetical protein